MVCLDSPGKYLAAYNASMINLNLLGYGGEPLLLQLAAIVGHYFHPHANPNDFCHKHIFQLIPIASCLQSWTDKSTRPPLPLSDSFRMVANHELLWGFIVVCLLSLSAFLLTYLNFAKSIDFSCKSYSAAAFCLFAWLVAHHDSSNHSEIACSGSTRPRDAPRSGCRMALSDTSTSGEFVQPLSISDFHEVAQEVQEQLRGLASAGLADGERLTTLGRMTEQLSTRLGVLETNMAAVSLRLDATPIVPTQAPPPPPPPPTPPPGAPPTPPAQDHQERVRIMIQDGKPV